MVTAGTVVGGKVVVDALTELGSSDVVGADGMLVVLVTGSVNGRISEDSPHAVVRRVTLRSDGTSRRDDPTRPTLP